MTSMSLSRTIYRENYNAVNVQTCRRAFYSENAVPTFSVRLFLEGLEQGPDRKVFAVKTVDK